MKKELTISQQHAFGLISMSRYEELIAIKKALKREVLKENKLK